MTTESITLSALRQGVAIDEISIPRVESGQLASHLVARRADGARLANLFARRIAPQHLRMYAVLAFDQQGILEIYASDLHGPTPGYPSVTTVWPAAQAFEREMAEQYGIIPQGHPWLKPLRYHDTDDGSPQPWGRFDAGRTIPGDYPFYRVEGDEVHEVAVGPVHAGIIEPGHFRFQCHGEEVLHLEIVLGYQHRAAEPLLLHPNAVRSAIVAETLAGDTSIGHALAYCTALEALADVNVSARAHTVRGIALELERLANHTGDLGALCTDIGFLPASSYLGRIRGEYLNLTAEICGNRFGRNLLRPGGVVYDVPEPLSAKLIARLKILEPETLDVIKMLFDEPSVLARFETTGALTRQQAEDIGLVGVAARACGLARDIRQDHPHGVYQFAHVPVSVEKTGDVFARAAVRWLEVQRSLDFLRDTLDNIPEGETRQPITTLRANSIAIGFAEGWRGEVMHVAITDEIGRLAFIKAKDPSIHNWFGLAQALRSVAISDFPLCNKSFNLSYCGHDL